MSQKVQNASSHPTPLRTHKAHGQFSGAMDEMSQKVPNASSHPWILPHTQRHTVNSAGRWMKVQCCDG